jgi:hypothetical protein
LAARKDARRSMLSFYGAPARRRPVDKAHQSRK